MKRLLAGALAAGALAVFGGGIASAAHPNLATNCANEGGTYKIRAAGSLEQESCYTPIGSYAIVTSYNGTPRIIITNDNSLLQ